MVILLLFNDSDSLTYSEIAEATAIPVADLKRALQSLACAKFKLLLKGMGANEKLKKSRRGLKKSARR